MKILIIDDEILTRKWLRRLVLEAAGEESEVTLAANGREGLALAESHRPELIFIDIRMPVMDGITFLQCLAQKGLSGYLVMLTSHADFSYARATFSLKANEYVLKSEMSREMVEQILARARQGDPASASYSAEMELKRASAFRGILRQGSATPEEIEARLRPTGITLENNKLIAVGILLDEGGGQAEAAPGTLRLEDDNIRNAAIFSYDERTLVVVANVSEKSFHLGRMHTSAAWGLIQKLRDFFAGARLGVSEILPGTGDLAACIRQCVQAALYSFFTDKPLNYYRDIRYPAENLRLRLQGQADLFFKQLDDGDLHNATATVQDILDTAHGMTPDDIRFLRTFFSELLQKCLRASAGSSEEPTASGLRAAQREVAEARSLPVCADAVWETLDLLSIHMAYSNDYVAEAIRHTHQHYRTIISTAEISAMLNINNEYFCRMFKSSTGETYSQFLIRYRLDKAEELLRFTSRNVAQVAEAVGYGNPNYFSRLYTKWKGVNPSAVQKEKPRYQ